MSGKRILEFGPPQIPQPQELAEEVDNLVADFAIHCGHKVLTRLIDYAASFRNTEVFGLLIGRAVRTPSGRLRTIVESYLTPRELAVSTPTFVEVSPRQFMEMDDIFQETAETKGLLKVGWFHTHPGHGIFMSHIDKTNHAQYQLPWQVALVLDPSSGHYGFFVGSDCRRIDNVIDPDLKTAPITATTTSADKGIEQTAQLRDKGNPSPAGHKLKISATKEPKTGFLGRLRRLFVPESATAPPGTSPDNSESVTPNNLKS